MALQPASFRAALRIERAVAIGTVPARPEDDGPSAAESFARSAIAGHPRAGVRRIILWLAALVGLVVGILGIPSAAISVLSAVAFVVTLAAMLLLSLTDQLS